MKDYLLKEIAELKIEQGILSAKIQEKKKQVAEMCCPYKVGQIFERTTSRGFSGKKVHERAILKHIAFNDYGKDHYRMQGKKLRKDGSESNFDAYLWSDEWKPVTCSEK